MRIIVVSDTHGNYARWEKIINTHKQADVFIHLGDGAAEFKHAQKKFKDKKFVFVAGNCDASAGNTAATVIMRECSKTIFATHGHKYGVKSDLCELLKTAGDENADIILYGHTHKKFTNYINGVFVLNPGSLGLPKDGKPSYGLVDITDAGIVINTKEVDF